MDISLEGKTALVTGSAAGVGRETLLTLARAGANVCVHYRNSKDAAMQTLRDARLLGVKAEAYSVDVTEPGAVKKMIGEIEAHFGGLDILVNNIGDYKIGNIAQYTIEDWHWMLDSNLNATWYTCHYSLPGMRDRKRGAIVNTGTAGIAFAGAKVNATPYHIAKQGVVMLTRSLAANEIQHGVRINMICPGQLEGTIEPNPTLPSGRFGKHEEVANTILFLVSDHASYITGSTVEVGGGYGL